MNESHLSANIWMVVAETTSYSCKKCLFLINLARFVIQLCNRIEFVGYQSRRHWNNFHEIAFVEGDHQQCLPDSWSFHSVILVHLCYSQRKQRNTAKICTLSQKVTRCIRSVKSMRLKKFKLVPENKVHTEKHGMYAVFQNQTRNLLWKWQISN